MPDWMTAFREAFPPDTWSDNDAQLDEYGLDSWPGAIKLAQAGCRPYRPDVVFHARFAQQVPELLAWANQHLVPVTARGAGSDVVGSSLPTRAVAYCSMFQP